MGQAGVAAFFKALEVVYADAYTVFAVAPGAHAFLDEVLAQQATATAKYPPEHGGSGDNA